MQKIGKVLYTDIDRIAVIPGGSTSALRNVEVAGDVSRLKVGDEVFLNYINGKVVASPLYTANPASETIVESSGSNDVQSSAVEMAGGFQRLFGKGPDYSYQMTFRDFRANDAANNILGFEDAQNPYVLPSGPFTMSLNAGWQAESVNYRNFLYLRNTNGANSFSLDWSSATAMNNFSLLGWFSESSAVPSDYLHTELRFWADQSPTASSKYWAMRVVAYRTSTFTTFGVLAYYGTGVTYSMTDGTFLWGPVQLMPGLVYKLSCQITTSSGNGVFYPMARAAEGGLVGHAGMSLSGWPTSFKAWKLYQPAGVYPVSGIDSISIS